MKAAIARITGDALRDLEKKCAECHVLTGEGGTREVEPLKPPTRWLTSARFDHQSHQTPAKCDKCHAAAATSTTTSDVLLPTLATCTECHGAAGNRSARSECALCHSYHGGGGAAFGHEGGGRVFGR